MGRNVPRVPLAHDGPAVGPINRAGRPEPAARAAADVPLRAPGPLAPQPRLYAATCLVGPRPAARHHPRRGRRNARAPPDRRVAVYAGLATDAAAGAARRCTGLDLA